MVEIKEYEKSKAIFTHTAGVKYSDAGGQHHIVVRPVDLIDWIEFLKEDLGYFTLSDIAGHDLGNDHFEIIYQLLNMGTYQRINLHLKVNAGEVVPSLVNFFSHAEWMEWEQSEMLNVFFDNKETSLILPKGQKKFPLQKKSHKGVWPSEPSLALPKLKFNPNKSETPYPEENYIWRKYDLLSPITSGNFELMACFDPLKVKDIKLRIGFHHQGIEKFLESKNIFQIIPLVDKINLSSAPNYSIAWTKTIEEMFKIDIPERAQAIRIVMLELSRIADHLTVLSSICLESEQSEYKLFLNSREKVYELFEKYSGHRQGLGVSKIGGVNEDLPYGWIVEYQAVADLLKKNLKIINNSLISKTKWREHLQGEPVNAQTVIQWGVTGPAMRAAGLNFDLRKSQPFYFYPDVDFDIPVGINGTIYDRYLIRFEEIFQSLRIITQVIDNLPLGDIVHKLFEQNYLERIESLKSFRWPEQWHYSALESPSGEAGFLVKLAETLNPARVKIKTPSFSLAQALPLFMSGLNEDQLSTCLSSLGLSRWELDR